MKKSLFPLFILLLLCGKVARGQETNLNTNESFKHHEIGFSIGIMPEGEDFWRPASLMGPIYEPDFFHYRTTPDSPNQSYKVGAFNFHYFYNITRKHSVGAVVSTTLLKVTIPTSSRDYRGINTYMTLNATYKFTYKSFPNIDFYLGVGIGATFGIEAKEINEFTRTIWLGDDGITDRFFVGPTAQLTLLGMRVGKAKAANIELGFGPEGILEVGYSYNF
ncbi:MAG: hypothetical protein IKU03_03965 [Bacteroidales bacterium]|nr:hypothetical protein [Bacteroidales bacterium]